MSDDISLQQQIDNACDEYESAWKRAIDGGLQPDLMEFLNQEKHTELSQSQTSPDRQKKTLAVELILLERFYLQSLSKAADQGFFHDRFPTLSDAIETAFRFAVDQPVDQSPDHSEEKPTISPAGRIKPTSGSSSSSESIDDQTISPSNSLANPTGVADSNNEDDSLMGQRIKYFGDYELLDEIARGGMGVVYRARQSGLNRIVALKMILSGNLAGQEEVLRFKTEAEAAAKLDHWGIVPIYEIGEHEDQHYFSMAFVDGESLQDKLTDGPLEPKSAARLCRKICESIEYAHQNGVVHRDLKPANVLIDATGTPKITDFGLAKQVESDSNLTRTGAVMGTPSYMPPEQASGSTENIGPLADVYSLGAMLYCMITGRPPFQAANTFDILMQVVEKEPVSPVTLNPKIPQDLQTITLKCLEKKPEQRYQSAAELADELQRFIDGKPILARPVSRAERAWRWCKRKPALASLGAVATALLIVLSIGGPLSAINQSRLKTLADDRRVEAEQLATKNERLANDNAAIAQEESAQRKEAEKQKKLADEKRIEAETLAEKNRKQLVASQLERADYAVISDPGAAIPHYLEALRLDAGDAEKERLHRIRLATAFGKIPKFTNFWKHTNAVNHIELDNLSQQVATSSHDRTTEVRWIETNELVCEPLKHNLPVIASAFSPDGKQLVTAASSGVNYEITFWKLATGESIGKPNKGFGFSYGVFWTQSNRVAFLASNLFGGDFGLTVMDAESRKPVITLAMPSLLIQNEIESVYHSASGRLVQVSGTGVPENTLRILDLNGELKTVCDLAHESPVVFARFNHKADRIVTATNSEIAVWDLTTGTSVIRTKSDALKFSGIAPNQFMCVGFGFDGRSLIFGSNSEQSFVLSDDGSIKHLANIPIDGTESRVASRNGRWMAFADVEGTVRIWDVVGERFEAAPMRHSGGVNWMEFAPDGRRLLTGCIDGTVRIWDFAATVAVKYQRHGHNSGPVRAAALSDDEKILNSQGYGWTRLKNLESGETFSLGYGNEVIATTVPANDMAAYGTNTGIAGVFDHRSFERISPEIKHDRNFVHYVELSSDGSMLATIAAMGTGGPNQAVAEGFVYDVKTGDKVAGPFGFGQIGLKNSGALNLMQKLAPQLERSGTTAIAISPDNRTIAYGGGTLSVNGSLVPELRLYDLESGTTTKLDHGNGSGVLFITRLKFSKTGKLLLSHGGNPMNNRGSQLRVWNVESGETVLGPFSKPGLISAAEFSDDERIVGFSGDRMADIYNLETGQKACRPLKHTSNISALSISPDGKSAATASLDREVRVWDLSEGRLIAPPMPHPFQVEDVTMLSNSRVMVCSHFAATVWDYQPAVSTIEDILMFSRLLTGQTLDEFGGSNVDPERLMADWNSVKQNNPQYVTTTQEQALDWYSRLLNEYHNSRAWDAETFHREHLIAITPDDVYIWELQSQAYGENRQFSEAAEYLQRVVEKKEFNALLMYRLSSALLAAGDLKQYQDHCDSFVEKHKDTDNTETADQLVIALMIGNAELDDSDWPSELIEKFLKESPEHDWLLIAKSLIQLRSEKFEDCATTCEKVLIKQDAIARAYAHAIRALAKQGIGELELGESGDDDMTAAQKLRGDVFGRQHGVWFDLANIDRLLAEYDEASKKVDAAQ